MEKKITVCDKCETPCIYPYFKLTLIEYAPSDGGVLIDGDFCSLKCLDETVKNKVK